MPLERRQPSYGGSRPPLIGSRSPEVLHELLKGLDWYPEAPPDMDCLELPGGDQLVHLGPSDPEDLSCLFDRQEQRWERLPMVVLLGFAQVVGVHHRQSLRRQAPTGTHRGARRLEPGFSFPSMGCSSSAHFSRISLGPRRTPRPLGRGVAHSQDDSFKLLAAEANAGARAAR